MTKAATVSSNTRLDVVDALRGFALFGIVFIHFMEQFYAGAAPAPHENYSQHMPFDGILDMIVNILMRGKFFMLFSFLFGLSFALQIERRTEGFWARFLWRLAVLFIIGFVHHLFYRGDILTVYAVVGIPLVLLSSLPNKALLVAAALLMLGIPRLIITTTDPNALNFQAQHERDKDKEIAYWAAAKGSSWLAMAEQNATWGWVNKWRFQVGTLGRAYQTLALFFLGLYAGRVRLFEAIEQKKRLIKRGLWWSLGVFLGLYALGAVLYLVIKIPERFGDWWANIIGIGLYDLSNLAHSAFYIFAFLLLYVSKSWWQRQILKLAPYGRMALTNYFLQSVIGTFIFFGWGLNQLDVFGSTIAATIALVIFIVQRYASQWWLDHYYFGPLEWLWRSATYWKWQPFKKGY
jgi:uncharacterized protein